ncbi:uncharacterized protein [Anser cygnoides]|uniref:uncharacterized protein isoform X3 n=1 Tax=Anser cygnoides TaxID=8845 RepID=UPI0034D22120
MGVAVLNWTLIGFLPEGMATWKVLQGDRELSHGVSWHERGLCYQSAVPTSEHYRRTLGGNIYIQWHHFCWCATMIKLGA